MFSDAVKNAIKDVELEGGTVTKEQAELAEQYANGKIDGDTLLKRIVELA